MPSPDMLQSYIPLDRRHALSRGTDLPDPAPGAVLFADVSGFTALTESFLHHYGAHRGAEEVTRQFNHIYDVLITEVHRYHGSVIGFSGDAITCWFPDDDGAQSLTCGLAMQSAMSPFATVLVAPDTTVALGIKVAVATGTVRRFLVGNPSIQVIDVLAGQLLDRVAAAEGLSQRGEVLCDTATYAALGHRVQVAAWRTHESSGQQFALVGGLVPPAPPQPWGSLFVPLTEAQVIPWLLSPVYQRLQHGSDEFLAELRPAVALFLRFSGINYDTDPASHDKLHAYISRVQHIIDSYGGILAQVTMGDKGSYLYATFGAPLSFDDDALRAVAAASELQHLPPDLAFIAPPQIGITRGLMYTGAYGGYTRRTYGVLGAEVNLSARLMSRAEPGQVLVSQRVVTATRTHYHYTSLGSIMVKGKRDPVAVSRLESRRTTSTPSMHIEDNPHVDSPRWLPDPVGRTTEQQHIETLLTELEAGKGGTLLIEGTMGVGKTTLALYLLQQAQQRGFQGLMGEGLSIETRTPYRAWRGVMLRYFDGEHITDQEHLRHHIITTVQHLAPDHQGRLPLLNDILNLDLPATPLLDNLTPSLRQQNLLLLLQRLLDIRAQHTPLILLIDDSHWLDTLSWEAVSHVARLVTDRVPLLLVLTLRPLESTSPLATRYAELQQLPQSVLLRLEELTRDELRALICNRLDLSPGELPPELLDLVWQRSSGNPLYAEEVLLALLDQGGIEVVTEIHPQTGRPHQTCHLTPDFTRIRDTLPDTVQGLILAHLDRMPDTQKLILKVASIFGQSVDYAPLAHLLHQIGTLLPGTLQTELTQLVESGLLVQDTPPPTARYSFRQAIMQETVYQTLLFAQRRELHRSLAMWYRAACGDVERTQQAPYYPLLAYHYRQSEDTDQERRYARLAGEDAAARYANTEAVSYLSRALELTSDTFHDARYTLLHARERVYDVLGMREQQHTDLDALASLANQAASPVWQSEVALRRANYSFVTGNLSATIDSSRQAVEVAPLDLPHVTAEGYLHWGKALLFQARYAEAHTQFEQALALARTSGNVRLEAESLRQLGAAATETGDLMAACAFDRQALELFQAQGDRQGEALALNSLAYDFTALGDFTQAADCYEQALALLHTIGDQRNLALTSGNTGLLAYTQGDYARAVNCYQQGLEIYRAIKGVDGVGWLLGLLGYVYLAYGAYTDARASFEQACHISQSVEDHANTLGMKLSLGLTAYLQGEHTTAADTCQQGIHLAEARGDRARVGEGWLYLGHIYQAQDSLDTAEAAYTRSLAIWQELDMTGHALEACAGLARVALARHDLGQSIQWVDSIVPRLSPENLGGTDEPLRVYLTCYEVLHAAQDPRASHLLQAAITLLQQRAAAIEDAPMRHSFLHNVATHARLLAAWDAYLDHKSSIQSSIDTEG